MNALNLVEWGGAALGMLGSAVLAAHAPWSRMGWLIWIASNLLLIAYTVAIGSWGLLSMQAFYMVTSTVGAWRSFRRGPANEGSATA